MSATWTSTSGPTIKEARVRAEFIDPFLESLGWDVRNVPGRGEQRILPLHQKLAAAAISAQSQVQKQEV